jgi:anti-sigma regulatory factor (Ser/Thr protein kinase)
LREITTAAPLVRSGAEGVFPAVTGCRLYLYVPARPSAVPHARRCVRSTLAAWQLDAVADDTELVVSELLTNAVRAAAHAAAVVVLYVALDPDWLSVLVWDSCPEPPVRPARAADDAESGRGLEIVDAVSERWGTCNLAAGGKIVWAQLGVPGPAHP